MGRRFTNGNSFKEYGLAYESLKNHSFYSIVQQQPKFKAFILMLNAKLSRVKKKIKEKRKINRSVLEY